IGGTCAKFINQSGRKRVVPGNNRAMAIPPLSYFPDCWHQVGVVQGHSPPANPAENHVARAEVVVRAYIELIESREACRSWELLPIVAGLQSGRAVIRQRKQPILNVLRNIADTFGRDHIIGEGKAGGRIGNRKIETAKIAVPPLRKWRIDNHEVSGRFFRAFIVGEEESSILLDRPPNATTEIVINAEGRGIRKE